MPTQIVPDIEYRRFIGLTDPTDAQVDLLNQLIPVVEAAVRREVGSGITQDEYTHILPPYHPENGDRRISVPLAKPVQKVLQLPEYPVRPDVSDITVYVDSDAYGGHGSNSWPASSLLTIGTDFYPDNDETGLCQSGFLISLESGGWDTTPGSIKVTYTAGWSTSELDGTTDNYRLDASDIKLACQETLKAFWQRANTDASTNMKREKLADYEIEFFGSDDASAVNSVPPKAQALLEKFCRVTNLVY